MSRNWNRQIDFQCKFGAWGWKMQLKMEFHLWLSYMWLSSVGGRKAICGLSYIG